MSLTRCSLTGGGLHIRHDTRILGILAYLAVHPGQSHVLPEGVVEDHLDSRSRSCWSVGDLCQRVALDLPVESGLLLV